MKKTLLLAILLLAINPVFATVRYVKTITSGSGNGSSWANASNNIQAMIQASAVGDEIWVASGDYKPNTYPYNGVNQISFSDPRKYCFHLKDGVKLIGGFSGNETSIDQRNLANNISFLNGDIGVQGDISDNCFHVVMMGSSSVLDGFTVKNGNANGTQHYALLSSFYNFVDDSDGGGLIISGGNVEVRNCAVTSNRADRYGGGVKVMGGITFDKSLFTQNKCISNGGGVYVESISLDTIRFSNATIVSDTAARGGGVFIEEGLIRIDSSDFTSNFSTLGTTGASIHFVQNSHTSVVTNSIFYNHEMLSGTSPVFAINHKLNLSNNLFENNTGFYTLWIINGRGNLDHNTFRNNSGAGFKLSHETFVSTISNNLGNERFV